MVEGSQFGGESSGPIFLDQFHCSGDEYSLSECDMYTEPGMHMCGHQHDVGVICQRKIITLIAYVAGNTCISPNLITNYSAFYLSSCLDSAASECDVDNGGCDHYCTETIQSYFCSCYPGYTLDTDQHTCVGESIPYYYSSKQYNLWTSCFIMHA